MAFKLDRSGGMTVLGVYLILAGLSGLVAALALPMPVMAILALAAGILILVGR